MSKQTAKEKRERRHKRIRARVFGAAARPRLYVFRSRLHIYAQLINDEKGQTILTVNDKEIKGTTAKKSTKAQEGVLQLTGKQKKAYEVGQLIAQKALANKITAIVFDRGGYKYHGRVKALAEGAREGGLKF